MRRSRRSTMRCVAGVVGLALGGAGCNRDSPSPAADGDIATTEGDEDDGRATADAGSTPQDDEISLAGMTIGIAVVGTQHFWDREAFEGAVAEVGRLGGEAITTDGGRDNQTHADNHDTFLARDVDAVITILGDELVEPKLRALTEAGIPVFGVDHASEWVVNNTGSDNYYTGSAAARYLADAIGGSGKVAVFNAFGDQLSFCRDRYQTWRYVIDTGYPEITITEELSERFADPVDDARLQTLDLLDRYPDGELDAIHVACWDQPALGITQALREAGRTDIVVSAIDAGPESLAMMIEPESPWKVNVAQQPRVIGTTAVRNAARHLAGENVLPQTFVTVIPVNGPAEAAATFTALGYAD